MMLFYQNFLSTITALLTIVHIPSTSFSLSTATLTKPVKKVIVVGGGVGGLAVASRIIADGNNKNTDSNDNDCIYHVTILEKNKYIGGRCGSFFVNNNDNNNNKFRHERGPSLLLLPNVYEDVFLETTGKSAKDFGLIMKQCIPAYQVIFDDGDRINVGFPRKNNEVMSKEEKESRQKMDIYEDNGSTKWDEYLKACEAFLDCGLPNFIEERFDIGSFPAFLREALRDFGKAWPLKPHSDVLDAIFISNKMKAIASFQDLYVGLEPYRNNKQIVGGVLTTTAPAVFGLLSAIELHPSNSKCGVYAPIGGFDTVSKSLERLADSLGVEVRCGITVTSVTEEGVTYRGADDPTSHFESADLIIVNADLPYATKSLIKHPINKPDKFDWDDKYLFSSGVIAFHWSLNRALDDLNTHNVFLAVETRTVAEDSWRVLRGEKRKCNEKPFESSKDPFNFYVHRASKTDPSAAPPGMDSLLVLVPCDTLQRDSSLASAPREKALEKYTEQFDETYIDRVRNAVFERMACVDSLRDIKSSIVDEVVDTPATYAGNYNVGAGTPFALSHGFAQLSLTRPGPASSGLRNVLFCGASTRPGNGVPLVLLGAKLVAKKALAELRRQTNYR